MKKKVSFILVTMVILASTISSFAAIVFSDVASSHWAKDYIGKAAEKKIIGGYVNDETLKAEFKPDNNVSYVESIQMIYNMLKAANKLKNTTGLTQKHGSTMITNKIPQWAQEAIAYALEYNILHPEDLKSFMSKDKQIIAKRVDVAIFLGKALDMKDALDPLPILKFVDAELVKSQAVPYVDLLVKKKIVNGDTLNKFNPNQPVTRAQMATMCSKSYDMLMENNSPVTPPVPIKPIEPKNTSKERIIDYVAEDTDMIVVKDAKGNTEVYNLKGVSIKINGKSKDIDDLDKGDGIRLSFNSKGELESIEVDNAVTTMEARIESIVDRGDYHLMTVRNKENLLLKKELKIYDSTEIEYDDEKSSVDRLVAGEEVYIKYVGDRAMKIEMESEEAIYDGILDSPVIFKTYPILKININSGKTMEFEIEDDATIRRDRRKAYLDELEKGDIATITVERGKIVEIIAASRDERSKDEGVIKQIIIGDPSKITILTDNKGTITYEISNGVDVEIDNKDAELKDLDIHYEVELKINNGKVTKIEAEEHASKDSVTGEIVKVYSKFDYMTVKAFDKASEKYDTVSVAITDDTKIFSTSGDAIGLRNLDEEDHVYVDGYYDDDIFVANKIIQLR